MRYLLDTCLVSELVKAKPNSAVVKWLEGCDEEGLFLSVLVLGEIQKGISKITDEKRKARMQHWLDSELRQRFEGRILPVSEEVALTWGIVQAKAELQGSPIPTIDGLVGATALAHNLTVVTRNERDIQATGARVFNPWSL